MLEPLRLVSFAALMFGISLVPGPAAAYCLAAGMDLRSGFSVSAAAGVTLGKLAHLVVAAVGAFWVTRLPGAVRVTMLLFAAAFMVVQGLRRWRRGDSHAPSGQSTGGSSRLLQGFAVSVFNPQSLASAVALFPLFLTPDSTAIDVASLTAVATLAVFVAYMLYEIVAAMVARRLDSRSQVRVVGATYMLAAVGLAVIAAS
ncbi:MAG: LysE family transporter [Acidimicrobiia bacterium]|nr:LysE family transporter [Acidimicrobiia bacterium]